MGVTNTQRRPSWELTGQTQGLQSGTRCAQGGHHYLQRRGEAQCPEGCCADRNFQNSLQPSLTNHFTPLPEDTRKAAFFTGEEETWEINTQSTMRPRQEDGERKKSPEISSGAP